MKELLDVIRSEPVAFWVGFVQSAITLGVSFGLHLSAPQAGSIIAVSGLVFVLLTRSQVSPKA